MCFSAEASFVGGAVIGSIGIATLRTVSMPILRWLALIPIMLALQQFSEGILWISFTHEIPLWLVNVCKYVYLTIAFLVWPLWIPFSVAIAEPNRTRALILWGFTGVGLILDILFIIFALSQQIGVVTINHRIVYLGSAPPDLLWAYGIIIIVPLLISSIPNLAWFGVVIGILAAITTYFYIYAFVSVWCFFSAIASLMLYYILKNKSTVTCRLVRNLFLPEKPRQQ